MGNERDASRLLLENTEYVPFERLKAAADKWRKADEIQIIGLFLTHPAGEFSLGRNGIVALRLADLNGIGKKEWLVVHYGDSYDPGPEQVRLAAPQKVTPEILQAALLEVFDPPVVLTLMEKLENGEPVIVKVEPESERRAHEELKRKLRLP